MNRSRNRFRGFTLVETLLALAIMGIVSAMVFSAMSDFLAQSFRTREFQELREDLYLTMDTLRRDLLVSSNVVAAIGSRTTGNNTLVLRQPIVSATGEMTPGVFRLVCYSAVSGGTGLVREVWNGPGEERPAESRLLNDRIVVANFLYNGGPFVEVADPLDVRTVDVLLASVRETGLRAGSATYEGLVGGPLHALQQSSRYSPYFPSLQDMIEAINRECHNLILATTYGSVMLRNRRALGL